MKVTRLYRFLIRSLLCRATIRMVDHDGIELAGYVAYTMLVALFPFLIFLFALAGFMGQAELANTFIEYTFAFLPREVAETLLPIITEVLLTRRPQLLTFSVIITLWIASSGVEAVRLALNRAYVVNEERPWWKRRVYSLLVVIGTAIAILTASFLIIAAPLILHIVSQYMFISLEVVLKLTIIRYALALTVLIACFAALYRWLPNCSHRWMLVLPGAAMTALLWLLIASLFSIYLVNFANYTVTYGSLGGIIITLLFLHISAIVFIFGAEFNAVLELKDREKNVQ